MRAGSGVVLEISSVTNPSHSGSNGVTLTMIPQRAYVDLPRHTVRMSRGIRKYSMVRASANEFGGTMHTSVLMSTNDRGSKFFGSTTVLLMFVNTLNSSATRMSYPYDDKPYDTMPARTWRSSNGSIMPCSSAMRLIHLSDLIAICAVKDEGRKTDDGRLTDA